MDRAELRDAVTIASGIIAVVTFALGLLSSADPTVALGVVGIAYAFVIAPAYFGVMLRELWPRLRTRPGQRAAFLFAVGIGLPIYCGLLAHYYLDLGVSLKHFDAAQEAAVLGLFMTVVVGVNRWLLYKRRTRGRYRKCPDCKEVVLSQARVCRYCGLRFAPKPKP